MYKNKSIWNFVIFALVSNTLLTTHSLAQESVTPIYNWKPSNAYLYNSIENKINIIAIEQKKEKFLLAFSSVSMPDFILFASIDKHGISSKIKISSETLHQNKENTATIRKYFPRWTSILSVWQLPPVPLQKKHFVEFQDFLYRFDGYSNKNRNVIKIEVTISNTKKSDWSQIIFFDIKNGIITDFKVAGKNPYDIIKLNSIKLVSQDKMDNLKTKYRHALSEDDFRLKLYRPELHKGNFYHRRSAFQALCQIKNENKLRELFKTDFLTEAKNNYNTRFCSELVDLYLYNFAMSGKEWAFNELVSPTRNAELKNTYSKCPIPIDGFDRFDDRHNFGKDSKKWKGWYKRSHKVLPKMKSSSKKELTVALKDKDPWVRLFAITTLVNRLTLKERSFLLGILKKAVNDNDKQVSKYAKETLDTLNE